MGLKLQNDFNRTLSGFGDAFARLKFFGLLSRKKKAAAKEDKKEEEIKKDLPPRSSSGNCTVAQSSFGKPVSDVVRLSDTVAAKRTEKTPVKAEQRDNLNEFQNMLVDIAGAEVKVGDLPKKIQLQIAERLLKEERNKLSLSRRDDCGRTK